ncbi:MAG: AAA family ATPase [Proteobacteria bacterium]|jgi:predicted kinase|nr:AAA family ATPase [Pseudomonadota bacterium]MDA1300105.1 AAA family ATPase [Pseudomonadota bacterium]
MRAFLLIFSGLPGTGKSTLSERLAAPLNAAWLRIDTIEQALRDLCGIEVQGEGYRLAYRLARDNLRAGRNVIADSCNPIALTRTEWRSVAAAEDAGCINVEVICSDPTEHRYRVEHRQVGISGLALPTWQNVLDREYHPWDQERIVVDTAAMTIEQSCTRVLEELSGRNIY